MCSRRKRKRKTDLAIKWEHHIKVWIIKQEGKTKEGKPWKIELNPGGTLFHQMTVFCLFY